MPLPAAISLYSPATQLFPLDLESPSPFFGRGTDGRGLTRQICVYRSEAGEMPVQKVVLDTSPSPLNPYYDHDTAYCTISPLPFPSCSCTDLVGSILFLWSKGSRQIHAYHLTPTSLDALPSFDSNNLQTSVTFLPKKLVDVRSVEILQGLRFAGSKIERFGFFIPRGKMEFFQDDVFPPTRDMEVSLQSAAEYWGGGHVEFQMIDLRPEDMKPRNPPQKSPSFVPCGMGAYVG